MSRPLLFFRRFSRLALFFMVAVAATGSMAWAAGDAVYTVENVQVDVTASDAATARGLAFTHAQQTAFQQLAALLVGADQATRLKAPDDITLSTMVKDYETTAEQLSTVRYIGTYTVRFRGPAVRGFLARQGLTAGTIPDATITNAPNDHQGAAASIAAVTPDTSAKSAGKPVLVLPFYQQGTEITVWGADNPWLNAWQRAAPAAGGVPILVPLGDADDIADLDGASLSYDHASLDRMTQRYNAADIALVMAVPSDNAAMPASATFTFYRTDQPKPQPTRKLTVTAQADETRDAFYLRATEQVRAVLQHDWKQTAITAPPEGDADSAATAAAAANAAIAAGKSPGDSFHGLPDSTSNGGASGGARFHVKAHFAGLPEWVRTQRALRQTDGVTGVHVGSLSPNGADVDFTYHGSADALRISLIESGLQLTPGADGGAGELRLAHAPGSGSGY